MNAALNRFNWIAPYYDIITRIIFRKSIERAHLCHLNLIKDQSKVLILGGGTGKWVLDFIRLNRTCKLFYVDASQKMINRAMRNCQGIGDITFIHGTESDLPDIKYDVVVTHFFLDMFGNQELQKLIDWLKDFLNSPSMWIVADFEKSKWWHSPFIKLMYLFFKLSNTINNRQLPDWHRILIENHFQSIETTSLYGDFIQCRAYVK